MHRRRALQLGGAAALVGLGGALVVDRHSAPSPAMPPTAIPPGRSAIVERLRAAPTRDILPVTAALIAQGTRLDALLGALFVAPLRTGSDLGDVHSVLAVEPVRRAIAAPGSSQADRRLAVLWAAAQTAEWLRDDRPPEPGAGLTPKTAHAACGAVIERIAERDTARADRAVMDCLALAGFDRTVRALGLAGVDSPTDPHRLIYLEQAVRGVDRFAADPALVLRSVARYMARTALPPDARSPVRPPTPGRVVTPRPAATVDPTTTAWVLDGLAEDPAALEQSDPPAEPAWHGLILWALRGLRSAPDVSGAAVHGVSLLHAALGACDRAADTAERRFILGRAARWLVTLVPDARALPPSRGVFEPDDALRSTVRFGSDAHDFKAVVALIDLGPRLPARWHGELAAALASTRVLRAPVPWPERAEARARLRAALRAAG